MKIIVVGAGIAGLSAAHYLSKNGHDVEVYESSSRAGGRAISIKRPDNNDICDAGSQYFHSNYRRTLSLLKSCQLETKLRKVTGYTRFFEEDYFFDLHHRYPWVKPMGISRNIKLALFIFRQLTKFKVDPYKINQEHSSDFKAISDITSDPDIIKYIVRPLTLAGGLSEPDTNQLSQQHLIRLIKIVIASDYLSLSSGNASLHDALSRQLIIHYEQPIQSIIEENNRVIGVQLANNQGTKKADHIFIATPPMSAARLLPIDWQEELSFLKNIQMPAFPLVNLFLDRPLNKKIWSYVLPQNSNIMMCTDAAQKNPASIPSGKSILQAWPCYPSSDAAMGMTDTELVNFCIQELAPFFPNLSEMVENSKVVRHQYSVPQFTVGHNQKAQNFLKSISTRNGISFCGDYFSGGYMESALWSVERAIKDIAC